MKIDEETLYKIRRRAVRAYMKDNGLPWGQAVMPENVQIGVDYAINALRDEEGSL